MIDIFSSEFLAHLKEEVKPKTKTSKAVLQALKDLSIKNQTSKKRIKDLEAQVANLKNENEMLAEMMQTNKQDYESRIQSKQNKLQKFIEIQAQISAENQSLKKQLENLKAELSIIKQIAQEQLQIPSKTYLSEKSISERVSMQQKVSSCELGAYLFSAKGKTEHSIGEEKKERDQQVGQEDFKNSTLEFSRRSKDNQTMWRSQQIDSINEMQKAVQMIMDSEDRQSSNL